ncbi:MAG: glycerophosphodiester phosphodiesterase family protein [Cyclobacteriaceae bacterium]
MRLPGFIVLIWALASCASPGSLNFADNKTVAHRGAWKMDTLPQNSIASLRKAIALKAAGSEFDVRMTKDGVLVINHDPLYAEDTIELKTYAELSQHKLKNGEKLPTLEDYLRAGSRHNTSTRLVVEVKPSIVDKTQGVRAAEKAVAVVRELKVENRVVYISFDYAILKRIHAMDPKAITQYLTGDKTPAELKADGISGADYHLSVYRKNPDWIDQLKKDGMILNAWTVNTAEDMDWLLDQGFDFITTDQPELLLERVKIRHSAASGK